MPELVVKCSRRSPPRLSAGATLRCSQFLRSSAIPPSDSRLMASGPQLLDDARTSPFSTVWPAVTLTSITLPALGDLISFSIFIASTISTPCSASTSSPGFTSTLTTRPGIIALSSHAAAYCAAGAGAHRAPLLVDQGDTRRAGARSHDQLVALGRDVEVEGAIADQHRKRSWRRRAADRPRSVARPAARRRRFAPSSSNSNSCSVSRSVAR